MKSLKYSIVSAVLLVPTLAFAVTVGGMPGIPHLFYGTAAYSDGSSIANGTSVQVKVSTTVVGSSIVSDGNYGMSPNELLATKSSGDWSGETAHFYIGGVDTGITYTLKKGGYTKLNLTLPVAAPVAPPVSGGTSRVGSGGVMGASQTTVSGRADSNLDGKVDIFDFNLMMVNWGKTGSNLAGDIDGNGKVDIFDFNLLMVGWTG